MYYIFFIFICRLVFVSLLKFKILLETRNYNQWFLNLSYNFIDGIGKKNVVTLLTLRIYIY